MIQFSDYMDCSDSDAFINGNDGNGCQDWFNFDTSTFQDGDIICYRNGECVPQNDFTNSWCEIEAPEQKCIWRIHTEPGKYFFLDIILPL